MLPYEVRVLLNTNYFGYLCTRGSYPHITPIFFAYDQRESLYFMSDFSSKKIRNIMKDPRVSLVVDVRDDSDPFNNEGVMVSGIAKIYLPGEIELDEYHDIYTIYDLFKSKYSEFVEFENGEDVIVEVGIWKVSYWKGPHFKTIRVKR
jgi:general stress protein 26